MKRLLLCTIVRNSKPYLEAWYQQLANLSRLLSDEWIIELSVYANDSVDGTEEWLVERKHNWEGASYPSLAAAAFYLKTERIGTQSYGSIWNIDRLRNLAAARQECLNQVENLNRFDKIAYVEPDCTYDPNWISELIIARHPKAAGIGEPDIYSGWSLRSSRHPKESVFLYDTTACRQQADDIEWRFDQDCGGIWRAKSIVSTGLTGYEANSLHSIWSTFNLFCVYNAKPFKEGVKWGIVNKRINPSGIEVEGFSLEADTVNICEQFRERGYSGIYLNTNCLVRHN